MVGSYNDIVPLIIADLPGAPSPLVLQTLQQYGRDFCRATESWIERHSFPIVDSQAAYQTAYNAAITAGQSPAAASLLGYQAKILALQYTLTTTFNADIMRPYQVWINEDPTQRPPADPSQYDFKPDVNILSLRGNANAPVPSPVAWATGIVYAAGINATTNGHVYLCAIAHTAGVFATDLAAGRWVQQVDGLTVDIVLLPAINAIDLAPWYMERWAEGIMAGAKAYLAAMNPKNFPFASPERVIMFQAEYQRLKNMAIRDRNVEFKAQGNRIEGMDWVP